jgi:hypothetical protein
MFYSFPIVKIWNFPCDLRHPGGRVQPCGSCRVVWLDVGHAPLGESPHELASPSTDSAWSLAHPPVARSWSWASMTSVGTSASNRPSIPPGTAPAATTGFPRLGVATPTVGLQSRNRPGRAARVPVLSRPRRLAPGPVRSCSQPGTRSMMKYSSGQTRTASLPQPADRDKSQFRDPAPNSEAVQGWRLAVRWRWRVWGCL